MFEQDLNWKMEKKEIPFPSPYPTWAWPNPFFPPPRPASLSLFPFFLLRPSQCPHGPPRGPRDNQRRASLILPQQLTAGPRAPVPLPGGAHWTASSSTSCPSRTRVAPQPRACFARSSSDSARSPSFKYRPKPRNPPS
jgi:hypothetical protein